MQREPLGFIVAGVAARTGPTDDDRTQAITIALRGLARHDDLSDIAARLALLHPRHDTFPAEVLLDLAADAIALADACGRSPIELQGIRDRHLPDGIAHTKAQHHKSKFALGAAAMLHGGVDPALLDEVQWWQTDDLWFGRWRHLPYTCVSPPIAPISPWTPVCSRIAHDRGVTLASDDSA